ncbi:MAG: hypothetical protein AB7O93_18430 [Vicinamibacterales bacterium]
MTPHEVAELLSLTGHELRAPAGVVGGYLGLLEKHADALSSADRRAVAGARRAQELIVEILDQLRQVAAIWSAEGRQRPAARTAISEVAALLQSGATDVVTEVAYEAASVVGDVPLTREELALVVDALAQVVVREHGGVLRCHVWRDAAACHVEFTTTAPLQDALPRLPFSRYRGGLGLALIRAHALVEGVAGRITPLDEASSRGVRATLPLLPSM